MARPKLGDGEPERLHVKISTDELTAIDDWRFENRVPSRSEAVRRLIQIGLRATRHLDQIVEKSQSAMEKSDALLKRWHTLIEKNVDGGDAEMHAMEVALAFMEQYPDIVDDVFSAYNLGADLGNELHPFTSNEQFPKAILEADSSRADAIEQWKRWAEEDANTRANGKLKDKE